MFFFWPKIVLAEITPVLISPADNSSEDKSPKLVWEYLGECVEGGNCFKVEIDNNSDFSSPEKETYSNSYSYSPRGLVDGVWFWRIRAKNKSDKWSDWSQVFKFNIGAVSSTLPAASAPSPTPEPAKKSEQVFEIKDLKSEINSDEEVEVSVLIKSDKAKTSFHVKGAFRQGDSINYFGETFFEGDWSKNNNSYSKQPIIQTDDEGGWEGKIKVRADIEDSGFKGSGDYYFKVGRYSESGNGPVWSNELSVKINEIEKAEAADLESEEEEDEEIEEATVEAKTIRPFPSFNFDYKIASVAGEATKSDNITLEEQTRVLEQKKVNWLLIILGIGILVGGIGYGVYQFRGLGRRSN